MSDQTRAGLQAYAEGDIAEALHAWSKVTADDPDFEHVRDYLNFVKSIEPSVFREVLGESESDAEPGMSVKAPERSESELSSALLYDTETLPGIALPPLSPSPPSPAPVPTPASGEATSWDVATVETQVQKTIAPLLVEPDESAPSPASLELPDSGPTLESDDAFDLVEQADIVSAVDRLDAIPNADPSSLPELERRLNELSELDDLNGALDVAKRILAHNPEHQAARAAQARSRDVLMKMSVSKIGNLGAVPAVLCPPDQVIWLDLDHRSGFILSQVDGVSTYQDIMEISGMDPLECATILAELVSEGVIGTNP